MFGVNSAAHAASRSAKTSPGAARQIGIVRSSSFSSALHRRDPRILVPLFFAPNYSEHPDELWLDCVKPRAEQQPELGSFLVLAVVTRDRVGAKAVL